MNKAGVKVNMLVIVAVGLVMFGLQIPTLGFFQDDWNFVFYSSAGGTQGLLHFLMVDGRPGATWVYTLGFALLGYKPALWQFFSLLLRILTTIVFWRVLSHFWPNRTYGNLVAAIFFLAYPFFTLQPLSVAYAPHFMAYLLYALSILWMIHAMERPDRYLWFSIPAVLCTFLHLFTVEYFIGLEFLRPVILWFALSANGTVVRREAWKKVFLAWLPYLLALFFFVFWRSFVLPQMGARHDFLAILSNFGNILVSVIKNMLADFILMFVSSWFKLVDPELFVIGPIRSLYFIFLTLAGTIAFYFSLKSLSQLQNEGRETRNIFLAGLLIFVIGMLSTYSVGYIVHEKIAPWNSRFALASMPGLALMSISLIEWLITSKPTRHVFLAVVFGLLAGWHNNNTLNFKAAWEKQSRLYEQLIWRAPSIQPGTAIAASEEILGYMGDYPTSYGFNTMYGTRDVSNMPLWFFVLSDNFGFNTEAATKGDELIAQRGIATFHGNQSDIIFISYEPEKQQCLWVLRPEDAGYKYIPSSLKNAASFSSYRNIEPQRIEQTHYQEIVRENTHTWCYFYQKADLARQQGEWGKVVALWQDAQEQGYRPANGFEYIPFIEAYAHHGQWDNALSLTRNANSVTQAMYFVLCPAWERLAQDAPDSEQKNTTVEKAYGLLRCTQ